MKNRKFIIVIGILTIVSIVGVGFTAWRLSINETKSGNLNIISSDVINTNNFIYFDTSKADGNAIESFEYYKNGFLNDDGSLNTSGTLNVYLVIDFDEGKNSFLQYAGVNALINLQCLNLSNNSYNIFNPASSKVSISYECFLENQTIPFKQGNLISDGLIVLSYSKAELNSESGLEKIRIQYTFEVNSYNDFKTYFYPILQNLSFSVESKIEPI